MIDGLEVILVVSMSRLRTAKTSRMKRIPGRLHSELRRRRKDLEKSIEEIKTAKLG